MMVILSLVLSGCDGVPLTAQDGLENAFTQRVVNNTAIVNQMYSAGLIDATTKDNIIAQMDDVKERIINKLASQDEGQVLEAVKIMAPAIVDWGLVQWTGGYDCGDGNHTDPNCCEVNASQHFITNNGTASGAIASNMRVNKQGATIQPIEIVDDASAKLIMERMNYPIYVISPGTDIDTVSAFLDEYTEGNVAKDGFLQNSGNFFKPLTDDSGNPVTLLDPDNKENQIIQYSTSDTPYVDSETNKVIKALNIGKFGLDGNYSDKNEPGKDLVITQHSKYKNMVIRFREFNAEVFNEKIIGQLGLGEGKYVVVPTNDGGRIYLMQYPVGYVDGFTLTDTKDGYKANILKSKLEVNLMTKKLYKVSDAENKLSYTQIGQITGTNNPGTGTSTINAAKEVEIDDTDSYLNLSLGSPETSSFIIYGETGVSTDQNSDAWNLEFGEKGVKASIPRIVLRDYLELSFAPGVSNAAGSTYEKFAVYGRKIRILNFEGALTAPVARFCGKDGVLNESSSELYISDLGDIPSLDTDTPYIKRLPGTVSEGVSTEADENNLKTRIASLDYYDTEKIDNMEYIIRDSIKCSLYFPSTNVGAKDYNLTDSRPLFYCMLVTKNYLESGLINWITSEDANNSTAWWNQWLKDHKFTYQIGSDEVLSYLKNNYTYELGQAGFVILDLDTIGKLQQELNEDANLARSQNMRSFFKVLGYCLMGYSFVLMLCWVADTSVDMGFNLLQKVTFGRLVAVAGDEELKGSTENNHVSYIGFQAVCSSAIKIAIIGIILIFLDIVSITIFLSETLGLIAQSIGKLIGG